MGQVTLFELLQHRQCPLLIELPQRIDGPFIEVGVLHQAYRGRTSSMAPTLLNSLQLLYQPTCLKNVVETFCNFLGQPSINERLVVLRVRCWDIHGLLFFLRRGRTTVHLSHSPVDHSQKTSFIGGNKMASLMEMQHATLCYSDNGVTYPTTCITHLD